MKTTGSSDDFAPKVFRTDGDEVVGGGGRRVDETGKNSSTSKKSKNEKFENLTYIGATGELMFLTLGARDAFNHLR